MLIRSNFTRRKEDIEEIYRLLHFITSVETHKGLPIVNSLTQEEFKVSMEMQCIMKSQFLITLYNLVESTVCDCLNTIYDTILDEGLTYSQVSDPIRKMWIRHHKDKNHPIHSMSEEDRMAEDCPIQFQNVAINVSGSLDIKKIHEIFGKHGCRLDIRNRDKFGGSFLVVKNRRNLLAHGNISFSDCGSNYIISDLRKYKNDVISGLEELINQVRIYIDNEEYVQK